MHPHLAARCGVLVPALKNRELRGLIERLVDLLVRFHDKEPRALVQQLPMQTDGHVKQILLKLEQSLAFASPDAYLPESAAARIVEDAILSLDRRTLELRLGEVQGKMAEADAASDHGQRKRLLAEQAALVDAIQALGAPVEKPPRRLEIVGTPRLAAEGGAIGPDAAEEAAALPAPPDQGPDEVPEPPWAGEPDDDPFAS